MKPIIALPRTEMKTSELIEMLDAFLNGTEEEAKHAVEKLAAAQDEVISNRNKIVDGIHRN